MYEQAKYLKPELVWQALTSSADWNVLVGEELPPKHKLQGNQASKTCPQLLCYQHEIQWNSGLYLPPVYVLIRVLFYC